MSSLSQLDLCFTALFSIYRCKKYYSDPLWTQILTHGLGLKNTDLIDLDPDPTHSTIFRPIHTPSRVSRPELQGNQIYLEKHLEQRTKRPARRMKVLNTTQILVFPGQFRVAE